MSAARYQLLVLSDERRGERIELLEDELSIGRSGDAGIRFDNPSVSRKHAVLRFVDDRLLIEDIGSSGGTKVNSSRIEAHRAVQVENGDEVVFGSFHTQVLAIDEYDEQYDDGEMTMFGSGLDLPDDLDEVLEKCERAEKNDFKSESGLNFEVDLEEDNAAPMFEGDGVGGITTTQSFNSSIAEPAGNPYRGLTVLLLVVVIVLLLVTLMAVFKWPVDLTALLK